MDIHLLADHTEVIPALTDWYLLAWEPYYGVNGSGDAQADLTSRCRHESIPIGLVAMDGDRLYGTVALDRDAATNLTPSVVGLLVGSEHRRKGIGTELLKSAEELARRLGYSRLYISTTILGELLIGRGWQALGEVEFLNAEQGSIYVRDL